MSELKILVYAYGGVSVFIDGHFVKHAGSWAEALRYCGSMGMRHVRVRMAYNEMEVR